MKGFFQKKLIWVAAVIVLLSHFTGATAKDIYLRQVNLPGELLPSRINVILPDSSGFLWLGTATGLFRWDGLQAIAYGTGDPVDLNVTALAQGNAGECWIGCADGAIFKTSANRLVPWKSPDTSAFSGINDLLMDTNGNLWWGTNGSGLYLKAGDSIHRITTNDGLPDNYIYTLTPGTRGEVWASTDRGIAICTRGEGILEISTIRTEDGLKDEIVRIVRKDTAGMIWLGFHEGGFCYYDPIKKEFHQPGRKTDTAYGRVDDIAAGPSGIWIADQRNGLFFSNPAEGYRISGVYLHGPETPKKIKSVRIDAMGNLWILGREGLFVSSGGAFTRISQKYGYDLSRTRAAVFSDDGTLWLAEQNSILKLGKEDRQRYLSGLISKSSIITSMKQDDAGKLWIGTFGDGILVFDPETSRHRFIREKHGLVNNSVLDISIRDQSVWCATLGGASLLKTEDAWKDDPVKVVSFNKENGLGNNFIYSVRTDSKGNVWFCTDGNGLVKYAGGQFTFFDESSGLDDNVVYSVVEDSRGDIWLSTGSASLFHFDGQTFSRVFKAESTGAGILALAGGGDYIFALTESGMKVIDIAAGSLAVIDEELDLVSISADLNNAFSGDEEVCFITEQGMLCLNTAQLDHFELVPRVVINRLLVNLEAVELIDNARFGASENKLIMEYHGFWHLAPGKLHYLTRLNGYDPEWQSTYDSRSVYANLKPGLYHFEVMAVIDDPQPGSYAASIDFRILKPYYTRWWFIVLLMMAFMVAGWWLFSLWEKRVKMKQARMKEKLEFEFQTLKNQINPHFLFNSFSTLINMIEEEPKIATEYAEKMSDFFRNILEVRDKELIPVREELRMIKVYDFIQRKRFGDNFTLDIRLDEEVLDTRIPPLTLQMLTENAIKHNVISRNHPLVVRISNDKDHLVVTNRLQQKTQAEPSTGLGLKNITERYQLITGKAVNIEIASAEFKVYLPII